MTKITKLFTSFVAAGMLLLASNTASTAQQQCSPRDRALGQLEKRHHEQVLGRGLTPNGKAMFELFVSKTGSWTMLLSHPNGNSCFVAAGDSWHEVEKNHRAGSI